MSRDSIAKWDKSWQKHPGIHLSPEANDWYNLVWQVHLEYCQELFGKLGAGKKMLECGAGSAKVSAHLAKLGYSCTMLDNSWEGLEAGKSNFKLAGVSGDFILADVEAMGLKSNSFDIVYSGGLLEHFHDVRPPVNEMVRVLKPGGVLAATIIPKRFSCQVPADTLSFVIKFLLHIVTFRFKGVIKESGRNFPFYENSLSLKEYRTIFEESGVKVVVSTGISPFPALPLPRFVRPLYVKLMKRLMPWWKRFDRSNSRFSEIWGASLSLYGIKRSD